MLQGADILKKVDHTLLKANLTWQEVQEVCSEAIIYKTATVCIPPTYVERVKENYGEILKISTVIGFPLGYSTTRAKLFEAREAKMSGADEFDMVINISDVKNGDWEKVENEIAALKNLLFDRVLKVIVETCYLEEREKILLAQIVERAGADYLKTSTGFGTSGANYADVELFRRELSKKVKIKASGMIRTINEMKTYLQLGADRIGASRAVALLKDKLSEEV